MKRKQFLHMSAMSIGALILPQTFLAGRSIDPMEALYERMDVAAKKQLADIALNVAKSKGASYADIRIGRYLNQFVATRENKLQGVANTESFGAGVRVIANGCWGFAASDDMNPVDIQQNSTGYWDMKQTMRAPVFLRSTNGNRRNSIMAANL